jgi:uncharacterized membrane protein (UPF0127 family)
MALPYGVSVHVAGSRRARLLGLALLAELPDDRALLIPRCRSVHTFGMRFALDLVWLGADGRVLAVDRGVPPGRVVACPGAAAVLEARAGRVPAMAQESAVGKVLQTLDPRQPIYRDTYNEYLVMVLSAGGAAAGTQVPLYIVMALTDLWSPGVFVAACVVFELSVIFGLARPQMKPLERVGWSLMWAAVTAALALCFYHLVAAPTL